MKRLIGFALAGLAALGAINAQATALSGSLGIAENACVESIWGTFLGANCSFSGGANVSAVGSTQQANWTGPLISGGFYTNPASAPAFVLSTQTGVDDNGTALNTFTINNGSAPGDGKVAPSVSANISINSGTSEISGTITISNVTRAASTGSSIAGSKTVVEQFNSIVHHIVPRIADQTNDLGGGMTEYIFGAQGFPPDLCSGTGGNPAGVGDCFATEQGFESMAGESVADASRSPWIVANGGTGPNGVAGFPNSPPYIDIVSFDVGAAAGYFGNTIKNTGVVTNVFAADINAVGCTDTGLDPKETGEAADTVTDCTDSSVAWGIVERVGDTMGNVIVSPSGRYQAAFDNMVMKVITGGDGEIISLDTYYTNEYIIGIPVGTTTPNAWAAGRFQLTAGVIPVPAAVWLFGSALGLLGWIRRRATA